MSTPTITPDADAAYARAMRRFSASLMSNAKWRKVFSAIASAQCELEYAEWWWIDNPAPCIDRFPREGEFLEKRFADGHFQPVEYRWIERIRIPRSWRPFASVGLERKQNLEAVAAAITIVGAFELEWETNSSALTLHGYKR